LAEHFEEGHRIAGDRGAGSSMRARAPDFFETLDGRVGDPQHRARAGGATVGFEEAAARPDDGE